MFGKMDLQCTFCCPSLAHTAHHLYWGVEAKCTCSMYSTLLHALFFCTQAWTSLINNWLEYF